MPEINSIADLQSPRTAAPALPTKDCDSSFTGLLEELLVNAEPPATAAANAGITDPAGLASKLVGNEGTRGEAPLSPPFQHEPEGIGERKLEPFFTQFPGRNFEMRGEN